MHSHITCLYCFMTLLGFMIEGMPALIRMKCSHWVLCRDDRHWSFRPFLFGHCVVWFLVFFLASVVAYIYNVRHCASGGYMHSCIQFSHCISNNVWNLLSSISFLILDGQFQKFHFCPREWSLGVREWRLFNKTQCWFLLKSYIVFELICYVEQKP